MSTVVLYCWCHSDSASVLLYFASVLMFRPISPEPVLFLDFMVSNIPWYFCVCMEYMDIDDTKYEISDYCH